MYLYFQLLGPVPDVEIHHLTRTWIHKSCGRVRQSGAVCLQTELGKYQKTQLRTFSACKDDTGVCVFHHFEWCIYYIQSFPGIII